MNAVILNAYLVLTSFFCISNSIFSQADTSFWFVAPDLQEMHGDRPVFFRISTLNNAAVVTISQPANPSFPVQTVTLAANSSQSVNLTAWINLIENQPVNTILNKGLFVLSTAKISCYYDITNDFNGDIFALKGKNALGTKFTIPFQQSLFSAGLPLYRASFEIVATVDNTTIAVLPRNNLMEHPAGISFTIVLNKGQTYSCAADSDDPLNRPGGSIVTSDKPISISTKDDTIHFPLIGCGDTAGDQLIPDAIAGTEFVIIRGYLDVPDNYYVFATVDATVIKVNAVAVTTINTGEFYIGTLSADACFVESTKPVQVFHISGFGCELGGAVVPSVRCTGSNSVSLTRATTLDFYINVITGPGNIAGFTLNGQNNIINSSQFQTVPGSGGAWMYAKILLNTSQVAAGAVARIENNMGKFHVGLIHGDQNTTCRYGFFSDFGNSTLQLVNNLSPYCRGSDVSVTAVSPGATGFTWQGPNAYVANGPDLVINNFQPYQQGFYKVTSTGNICGTITDSVFIGLKYLAQVIDTSICQGLNYAGYTASGTYIDTLGAANGCDSIRIVNLTVKPKSLSALSEFICFGQNYSGYGISGVYTDTFMSVTGCDSIRTINLVVKQNCEIYFPSAFSPNNDGRNDQFKILSAYNLKDYHLIIYNRWGQLVFETVDHTKGWNGKFNGEVQPSSTFIWYCEFLKPRNPVKVKMKGSVTLVR